MTKDDLRDEIKELNKRIADMEKMMRRIVSPIHEMQDAAGGYFRLVNVALKNGGLTPDMLLPELTDDIQKAIVKALVEKNGQNISQITESVRKFRGTSSRRTIRNKLKELEQMNVVEIKKEGARENYHLTEEVLKKWSQMLGINI